MPFPGQQSKDGLLLFDNPGLSAVNKFGRNSDVDSGIDTDIWDGATGAAPIYIPPTAARVHAVTSGHADDTALGPGAQAVEVQGLDASWRLQAETVELAGAGSVNTANSYIRIFRAKVTRVGANGAATSDITVTAAVDATVSAKIITPNNQTLMAVYTVPDGSTAYITQYYSTMLRASPVTTVGNISLLAKEAADVDTSPWQLKHVQGMFLDGIPQTKHSFDPWFELPGKTDIKMQAVASQDNTDVSAGFDIVLRQSS
jgi:hypothetical protein